MATLRRELAVDAVLFVDVTAFRAYAPLVLGLRGKLATIEGTRLVWTFDNVFSADEPAWQTAPAAVPPRATIGAFLPI